MTDIIVDIYDGNLQSIPHKDGYCPLNIEYTPFNQTKCMYIPVKKFQETIALQKGQISLDSEFGSLLYLLMSYGEGPTKWLEVGSWNGRGTTRCILEGLLHREEKANVKFVSYEANPAIYPVAKENLEVYKDLSSNFTLFHGKLPSSLSFPLAKYIPEKSTHFTLFFEDEKYIYEHAESINPPFSPEVIVLDGGEYVGYQDWEAIPKENLKHIFLDDISIYKNKGVHQLLKYLSDWECVLEKPNDRNGWAYWRKRVA